MPEKMERNEPEEMTKHDKAVLREARRILKQEKVDELSIGKHVVSRKKIVRQLKNKFPQKNIKADSYTDYSYREK